MTRATFFASVDALLFTIISNPLSPITGWFLALIANSFLFLFTVGHLSVVFPSVVAGSLFSLIASSFLFIMFPSIITSDLLSCVTDSFLSVMSPPPVASYFLSVISLLFGTGSFLYSITSSTSLSFNSLP